MSFDSSLPGVRDRLRLQLGDTSGNDTTELLTDEIYDAVYAYHGNNEPKTLVALAESLIAKFSQAASSLSLGDMSFNWRDRLTAWQAIIDKFQGISSAEVGGGFVIQKASRPHPHDSVHRLYEYKREILMEPWWNDPYWNG